MIYLNSLLRSSILFAAETMYDTKEVEYRLIERIEEDLLRKIFKTGSGCPIFQLYLESGHIPARFAIKRMKVIFFKYIISQDEGSLMFKLLMAQKNNRKRGDWYSEVKNIINELNISLNDEDIKKTTVFEFKKIVKEKTKVAALKYLKEMQRKDKKGAGINYNSIELQDYWHSCANIKLEDQQFIFNFRSEMNQTKENFHRDKNMKEEYCIKTCKNILNNEHITWCPYLNEATDYKYSHILNGDLNEKLEAYKQIKENTRRRKEDSAPCDPVLC